MSDQHMLELMKFIFRMLWYSTFGDINKLNTNSDAEVYLYQSCIILQNSQFDSAIPITIVPRTFTIYDDKHIFMLYDMVIDERGHISCPYDRYIHSLATNFNARKFSSSLDFTRKYDLLVSQTRDLTFKLIGILSCSRKWSLMDNILPKDVIQICAGY